MGVEVSPIQKLRALVRQAAKNGGRVDLVTYHFMHDGKQNGVTMVLGTGEQFGEPDDIKGPLTELFIEQTARRTRPDLLASDALTRPTKRRREQYFDIASATVQGRDVRLGVEVVVDDGGEQRRTYFAEGPSVFRRWARDFKSIGRKRNGFLPPDSGDRLP